MVEGKERGNGMSAATNANTVSAMDIDSRVDAAIELRRAVLTADPNDEFARSALVRRPVGCACGHAQRRH
jgi:hypothetical protein